MVKRNAAAGSEDCVEVTEVSCKTKACDGKTHQHRRHRIWITIKQQHKLIDFQALPDYLKDNPYILKYYRADWPLSHAFLSVFFLHNETLNIWTHLVGFVLFLALTIYTATIDIRNAQRHQQQSVLGGFAAPVRWPFFVFLGGAMGCLLTSSISHLLSCHSKRLSSFMWRLDYAGIALMIAASFYPPIYYVFLCEPKWQYTYLSAITVLAVAAVCVTIIPCLHQPKYRIFRTVMFVGMGLFGVMPGAHAVIENWHDPMCFVVLSYELAMVFFYLLGTLIYAARVPERWKPGVFDIAGHSHQIFHVLVVAGAYAHYSAALIFLDWRIAKPCILYPH